MWLKLQYVLVRQPSWTVKSKTQNLREFEICQLRPESFGLWAGFPLTGFKNFLIIRIRKLLFQFSIQCVMCYGSDPIRQNCLHSRLVFGWLFIVRCQGSLAHRRKLYIDAYEFEKLIKFRKQ